MKQLQEKLQQHFNEITKEQDMLFTLNLEKNELWDIYLNSFEEKYNGIYRERRVHDCSACRHFVNQIGDVVVIKDNKLVSIWDFDCGDDEYRKSIKAVRDYVHSKIIKDVYLSRFKEVGTKYNHEDNEGTIITYYHYHLTLPPWAVIGNPEQLLTKQSKYRDIKNVFKRSLEEISKESVDTVLELIGQNSLYRGEEWKSVLTEFKKLQQEYLDLTDSEKDNYLWSKVGSVGVSVGKIRNHSMGTLLTNITEGMELDVAVKKYESIVAPTNYKRPKPIYTKKMLDDAKKKIEELGFKDSLKRRYAILEDISINDVLFANTDSVKRMQGTDVFEEMEQEIAINPNTFNKVEEVPVDKFIKDVLPSAKTVELFLEGRHSPNMVSLIAPYKVDSKTMFKWGNNFSWAYSGNITDSDLKANVKSAGGKVDGVLRFSIQWNDNDYNPDDYDAHCIEPCGNKIYFSNKCNYSTGGNLDIDIINPTKGVPAVENITWPIISKMNKGTYKFLVHNYSHRGGKGGFRAEIEYQGEVHRFDYQGAIKQGGKVQVAEVTFDGNNFTIKNVLPSQLSSVEKWSLKTNNFIPVSTILYSPNYWGGQGVGNKHYFFMLKGCKNDENPSGFFNEYLNNELTEHRKVFEALSGKMKVDDIDNQLSGVGFSSTQSNSVVVRVTGATKRVLRIRL